MVKRDGDRSFLSNSSQQTISSPLKGRDEKARDNEVA